MQHMNRFVPSFVLAGFLLAFAVIAPRPAAAQLTGGLEGRYIHHVFEVELPDRPPRVIAEAWSDRASGVLWVRGEVSPALLRDSLRLTSKGTDTPPPRDTQKMLPTARMIDAPSWLKGGHVWARPGDGVADTALRLVLERGCVDDCAVVAIERYVLPDAEGMVGGMLKLTGVDRYPIEPGDELTVYAPR